MAPPSEPGVQRVGFVLIPGFALMSFASATEPLRAANILAGREIYRTEIYSPAVRGPAPRGGPVAASAGAVLEARPLPGPATAPDLLFVCAGGGPADWDWPGLHAGLRALARAGVRIGGISGGPYVLAAAGLLDRARFTIHWEHADALAEAFPALRPDPARFVIDGARITCGGGVAPLDLMHALIAERMGAGFARRVSDWLLHTEVRAPEAPQRAALAERYGVHHPGLLAVLGRMEASIEAPVPRAAMAALAGVSPRQLDRLFARHLGTGFAALYRRIRLDHARRLLRQSPLSVSEIALATGFSGPAHFARAYRAAFGQAPGAERRPGQGREQRGLSGAAAGDGVCP